MTTALARRPPSHFYACAYRALLEARHMLEDPERYYRERVRAGEDDFAVRTRECFGSDASGAAYEVAMRVSAALRALPELSPERVEKIHSACWRLDPRTGVRGNVAYVERAMAEVWHLCDEAAREDAGALAIVPVDPERRG